MDYEVLGASEELQENLDLRVKLDQWVSPGRKDVLENQDHVDQKGSKASQAQRENLAKRDKLEIPESLAIPVHSD